MSMKYVPTSFFKTLRNEILKPVFDANSIELEGVDWENRVPESDKSVAVAWTELRGKQSDVKGVSNVHEVFQCISELGKPVSEINYLAHQFETYGRFRHKLRDDFDSLSRQEQAAVIYAEEGRRTLLSLVDAAAAKSITPNRWTEFANAPQKEVEVTQAMKDLLAEAINTAYGSDKGGHCHVETYPIDDGVVYFLGKMDDKPEFIEMKKPGEEDYGYSPVVRPFNVTLAYDYVKGKISIHGTLAKKKMYTLADTASKLITGEDAQLARKERATYDLTELARIGYKFPVLPGSGVKRIYIKTLVLHPDCSDDSEVTFKNIGDGTAYDSIEEYHRGYQLPEGTFRVVRANIIMEFDNADVKAIKFELTPKTCTQTGLLDSQRKLVEKLIDAMGIEESR